MTNPLDSAKRTLAQLIGFDSVSDRSNQPITRFCADHLESLGFEIEWLDDEDSNGVAKSNIVACRRPTRQSVDASGLAYLCHTDVVPADGWTGPGGDPFEATETNGRIYGRGACDMKGSIAVALAAVSTIDVDQQNAPIWFVCTADEEVGFAGARQVVASSTGYAQMAREQPIAIVGEPTCLGVHHAHKGIAGFKLTSLGKAAHSSTRHGKNANVAMVPLLGKLLEIQKKTLADASYQDSRFDPPDLSWNFGFSDHTSAVNITPQRCDAWCSFRPMPGIDGAELVAEVEQLATASGVTMKRFDGCDPLWIDADSQVVRAIVRIAGGDPTTVCYATDGGVFTSLQQRVVFGPGDIAQAHTTNEWLSLDQLDQGLSRYRELLQQFCCRSPIDEALEPKPGFLSNQT